MNLGWVGISRMVMLMLGLCCLTGCGVGGILWIPACAGMTKGDFWCCKGLRIDGGIGWD